jgi:hypothetical protein
MSYDLSFEKLMLRLGNVLGAVRNPNHRDHLTHALRNRDGVGLALRRLKKDFNDSERPEILSQIETGLASRVPAGVGK